MVTPGLGTHGLGTLDSEMPVVTEEVTHDLYSSRLQNCDPSSPKLLLDRGPAGLGPR